jgi:YebC/PmpR family DNA-binding regulatory protein
MIQAMTDNRNRTVAEVRNTLNKNGGNLGEAGCVDWIFEQTGIIELTLEGHDPDELTLMAIDAGAQDVDEPTDGDETLVVYTEPADLDTVRKALDAQKLNLVRAETVLRPKTKVELDEKAAMQTLRLIDRLEDLDDVQNVYTNAEIPDAVAEQYAG